MGSLHSVQRLPVELVINILLHLDTTDIHFASRSSRRIRDIVSTSNLIQCQILLDETGSVACNCESSKSLTLAQRATALRRHQYSWSRCEFLLSRSRSSTSRLGLNSPPCEYSRYFRQGIYILRKTCAWETVDDSHLLHLYKIVKATTKREETDEGADTQQPISTRLKRLGTVHCLSRIRGFSFDRFGEDLLAMVSIHTVEAEDPNNIVVELHLRQFSTMNPHPRARLPDLIIANLTIVHGDALDRSITSSLKAKVEIIGRFILILLRTGVGYESRETSHCRLLLVDWVIGSVLSHDHSFNRAWSSLTLLTDNIVLLANNHSETIDVVRLPISSDVDCQIANAAKAGVDGVKPTFSLLLRLRLPQRIRHLPTSISLRSHPGPKEVPCRRHSDCECRPFASSPKDAMIQISLVVDDATMRHEQLCCDFVVHRSALISILEKYSDVVESAIPGPLYPPNSKKLNSRLTGPNVVKWKKWGPRISHCFGQDVLRWGTEKVAYGQRVVWVDTEAGELVVWDFNPCVVLRARAAPNARGDEHGRSEEVRSVNAMTPEVKLLVETRTVRCFERTRADVRDNTSSPNPSLSVAGSGSEPGVSSKLGLGVGDCIGKDKPSDELREPFHDRCEDLSPSSTHGAKRTDSTTSRGSEKSTSTEETLPRQLTQQMDERRGDGDKVANEGDDIIAKALKKLSEDREAQARREQKKQAAQADLRGSKPTRKLIESNELNAVKFFKRPVRCSLPCLETRRTIKFDAPYVQVYLDDEHLLVENIERADLNRHDFSGRIDMYSLV